MSRVGKSPIPVPSGVDVTVAGRRITVKGPKGTLERDIPGAITVRQDGEQLIVERPDDERQNRAMHGLVRSLVNNMVVGVTQGFRKEQWWRDFGTARILLSEYVKFLPSAARFGVARFLRSFDGSAFADSAAMHGSTFR